MNPLSSDSDELERAKLLAQIEEVAADIRRRAQELLARADIPEFFKNHPVVKELVK